MQSENDDFVGLSQLSDRPDLERRGLICFPRSRLFLIATLERDLKRNSDRLFHL